MRTGVEGFGRPPRGPWGHFRDPSPHVADHSPSVHFSADPFQQELPSVELSAQVSIQLAQGENLSFPGCVTLASGFPLQGAGGGWGAQFFHL